MIHKPDAVRYNPVLDAHISTINGRRSQITSERNFELVTSSKLLLLGLTAAVSAPPAAVAELAGSAAGPRKRALSPADECGAML